MAVFAVEYTYPREMLSLRDEHRPRHREWLAGQLDAGTVILSGPYTDGSGAFFLIRAEHESAVRTLVAADPFQQIGGVSAVRVTEWTPVFGPVTAS